MNTSLECGGLAPLYSRAQRASGINQKRFVARSAHRPKRRQAAALQGGINIHMMATLKQNISFAIRTLFKHRALLTGAGVVVGVGGRLLHARPQSHES